MLKRRFYLKDRKNPTLVYYQGNFQGKVFKIYMKFRINPEHWNKDEMMVREVMDEPHYYHYNKEIIQFRRKIDEANLILHKFKNIDMLLDFLKGEEEKRIMSFLEYLDKVHCKSIPNDKSILKNLKKYQAGGRSVDWDVVQKKTFADRFYRYLEKKEFSLNYIGRHFKVIKTVIKNAFDDEIIDTCYVQFLKVVQEEVDVVYLNNNELKAIYEAELKGRLDDARDRFLIGCYTGLRFNDFVRLDPDEDIKDGFIKIRTGKGTGNKSQQVVIPVHPIVQEILEKRDNKLPHAISNQKLNEYLKDIAKAANLNDEVAVYKTKGGKTTKALIPKWKLITTHTARRSFATNAFKAGVQSLLIMKITGHRTEKNFLRYIRISSDESARLMAESSFFQ